MAQAYRGARANPYGNDTATYDMSWDGFGIWFLVSAGVQALIGGSVVQTVTFTTTGGGEGSGGEGSSSGLMTVDADTTQSWRAWAENADYSIRVSSQEWFKSRATGMSAGSQSASNPTAHTVDFAGYYYVNTVESVGSATLQYKKTTDSTWINYYTDPAAKSGYGQQEMIATVVGLDPSTSYQFQLSITRNTVNDTVFTTPVVSCSTIADAPTIVTNPATGVSAYAATMNATVDPNTISTNVTFEWDTNSGVPYAFETSPAQNFTGDGNQAVSKSIANLSPSTPHYFRAKAVHAGGTVYGSEQTFTTPVDPLADSILEDHMQIFEFNERKYGVAAVINFAVASPAATSSDRFFNAATPFVAGDVQISKDGGAYANVGTLPARIGTTPNFALSLTATEMQATTIVVMIVDAAGTAFRDAMLVIRTKQEVSQIVADATQLGGNAPAMSLTGIGTSPGLLAAGGATAAGDITGRLTDHVIRAGAAQAGGASTITLDTGAAGTNGWYNGSIVMLLTGIGAGQSRVIQWYDGTSKVATVNRSWIQNPAASDKFIITPGPDTWNIAPTGELTALPTFASSYGQFTQLLFQRFAYKIDQTATLQTWYKSNAGGGTAIFTRSVSDDGATQTVGQLT